MQYPQLPLLHIVQSAARVSTVDPAIVALAFALLLFSVFLIWIPRPLSVGRLTRSSAVRVTMSALVFFALLPSVVPYDHLIPGLDQHESLADEAMHSTHCHITPGSCADAPITASQTSSSTTRRSS